MRSALPYCSSIFLRKPWQRGLVGGVAGHHLIGQRKAFRRDDQRNDHLHAIGPLVPAVAVPALVAFRKGRIALEIGAGQIVEQHVELRVEQIFPALRQVVKQRFLMFNQPVQALVEFMDLRQFKARPQQIGHRAVLIPVPMQPPFAAGIDQTIAAKRLNDQIPARPLAARRQPLCPELIKTQLLVQRARQPARTPLPGPAQFHILEPNLHHLLVVDLDGTILGKQRHRLCRRRPILENLDRLAPRLPLRTVNLAEVEHLALNDPSTSNPAVLHHVPVTVLFTIFLAIRATEEHGA